MYAMVVVSAIVIIIDVFEILDILHITSLTILMILTLFMSAFVAIITTYNVKYDEKQNIDSYCAQIIYNSKCR